MTLKKKLAAALAAAGLAVGLSLAGTGTARATDFPTPGQWAEIFNPYLHAKGNTLCFDDPNGSTSFGTQVQLYRCHGYASNGAPQRWVFVQPDDINGNPITEGGNNVYELYNLAAGRCLAVTGTSVGHPLIMGSCITSSTSIAWWELRPTTPASHDFQLALWLFDDWCIGADDFRDNSPTRLLLFGCSPTDTSQLWTSGSAPPAPASQAAVLIGVDAWHRSCLCLAGAVGGMRVHSGRYSRILPRTCGRGSPRRMPRAGNCSAICWPVSGGVSGMSA